MPDQGSEDERHLRDLARIEPWFQGQPSQPQMDAIKHFLKAANSKVDLGFKPLLVRVAWAYEGLKAAEECDDKAVEELSRLKSVNQQPGSTAVMLAQFSASPSKYQNQHPRHLRDFRLPAGHVELDGRGRIAVSARVCSAET